jgi:hypothetical protein
LNENELEEAVKKKKEDYETFIKRWSKARDKWDEWEKRRIEMENELVGAGIDFEAVAVGNNTWHEQRRVDFDPVKDGKMQTLINFKDSHYQNYDIYQCETQCPRCKSWTVFLEYKVKRGFHVSVDGADIKYTSYDIRGIEGTERIGDFWYCKKCAGEMTNEGNSSGSGQRPKDT